MLSLRTYELYKQGANIDKNITSSCLYPVSINVTDSLGHVHKMYVPCGRCIACHDLKRNEWVSRMCLHSLTYKHCYFVTLTYGSYNLYEYVNHPFKDDWLMTKPRLSSKNYNNIPKYMPSLLRQEHLTKFLKRLRIELGFNISYCAAGEYGEKYLRPHFHLIIWSDDVITYENIVNAWSYKCYSVSQNDVRSYNGKTSRDKSFQFLIGRVDFHDLVANGTLDYDTDCNKTNLNSKHVFSYVAKYVCKSNFITSRLKEHILQEYNRFDHTPWYDDKQDNENVINSVIFRRQFCKDFKIPYEAKTTLIAPFVDDNGKHLITLKHNQKIYEKVNQDEFVKIFAPFFVCSRKQAIGRKYFEQNFDRFQAKCFDLPTFHSKKLTFPHYFMRLLQNEKYPIYFKKSSLQSVSYSRDFIPLVRDLYMEFSNNKGLFFAHKNSPIFKRFGIHKFGKETFFNPVFINNDGYTIYYYSPTYDVFEGFRFNRSTKEYEFKEYVERKDFCEYIVSNLNEYISDIKIQTANHELLYRFQNELLSLPTRLSLISSYEERRKELSLVYNIQHNYFSKL